MSKKLFLLDAFALIYRAHFAFIKRPLINSKGQNVSCVNGFTSLIWDLIQKENPTHIAIAFDLHGPTFRHEMYEPYKAQRDEQPEDITLGLPYIFQIIEAMNIPIISCQGYEADDVIGTIAKQASAKDFEVYMVTSDKDYGQLVSEKVFLYKPGRMGNEVEILGVPEILEIWGIQEVHQVVDMLGLQGDAVDNIPGVKGIGPKTAQQLISKYHSIEGILNHMDELPEKQKLQFQEHKQIALLSKKLAAIDTMAPIEFDETVYQLDPVDKTKLQELFKTLEFRSLAKRILGTDISLTDYQPDTTKTPQLDLFGNVVEEEKPISLAANAHLVSFTIENTKHQYHLVDNEEKRKGLIQLLSKQKEFCFDTETTGLELGAEIVGMSFAIEAHEAYYMPFPVNQEKTKEILAAFKPLFENKDIAKIGQNIKFDLLVLKWYGIHVAGKLWDTMIMHYLIEPDQRHNMDFLAETYLNYSPVPIENLLGKGQKKKISMREVPLEKIKEYAAEDADITWQLKQKLDTLLLGPIRSLYEQIEEPLIQVLADIEFNGVHLDVPFLEEYSYVMEKDIQLLRTKILEETGSPNLNLDSPKQIGEVLFDKLKLPYRWRKTKTGQYSTDEEVMTELALKYSVVKDILDYRQLAKLKSTYIDALPRLVNEKTGRLHSSFNQALTSTGRLSSQNPNLQNIPIRTDKGREIRKAFIPKDNDHLILAADYSQIELRLIAEISGEEAMLKAFRNGEDIHTSTASLIYGVPQDQVNKTQRYNAKTVNFSIIYGAGATNLSQNLGIKRTEASALIEQYFKTYNGLKKYMEQVVNQARNDGYVSTIGGRRRYLRDLDSKNGMMRSHAERNAVNTPVQGSAADLIKIAMVKIFNSLQANQLQTKMILQVHDELVFDVPKNELNIVKPLIESCMKNAMPQLSVPMEVGIDTGNNWLEAH